MKIDISSLEGKASGSLDLSDDVFGLEPRGDILQRVVRWQLAKRRAGTHDVKNRAEIARTGKKMYGQKGTGRARHSSARAPQFRGGGRAFGPTPRDHGHDLPKKVRALGLKLALSSKVRSSSLLILDQASMKDAKTAALLESFGKLGLVNALIIDGASVDENFGLAARNIPHIDVLPVQGINVYDILRRDKLVLTRAAVEALEARLK
ncbi:50S ribosomal protein L4 [Candidatus Raskinella chloraquaticus]|uniref:Large ribosomal subunit protein uL4 n=1 Tax=Candidatus Raskinella chloraquaticus TaxID=1951219 RepID=A0A1W9HVQ0_9HYPH|nr:MAG: 50S ribosomal protein L4 [Proteobacteria bacterium SG_bin8]